MATVIYEEIRGTSYKRRWLLTDDGELINDEGRVIERGLSGEQAIEKLRRVNAEIWRVPMSRVKIKTGRRVRVNGKN